MLSGSLGFCATNNCPVTSSSQSQSFVGGSFVYNNITVPDTGTGAKLSGLAGEAAGGCTAIDLAFTNFAVSATGNSGNALTTGNTYLLVDPSGTTQTSPDSLLFATVRGTGTGGGAVDGGSEDGVNNYVVTGANTYAITNSFDVTDGGGTLLLDILQTVGDIGMTSKSSGNVTLYTCLQGTGTTAPTGPVTTQAACNTAAGANGVTTFGIFQTEVQTLSTAASLQMDLVLSTPTTYADVTQVINLSGGGGTDTGGFVTLDDQFDETPEPSTFVLLGTALAVVAFMYRRRKALAPTRN